MATTEDKELIENTLQSYPDFPKPGILFWDVAPLLYNPKALQAVVNAFAARYADKNIDAIAGFEARGFLFGTPLALALNCSFVPLRKPGKLPGETIGEEYTLEYGSDKIEMQLGAIKAGQKVLLLDDLVATGGTMAAGVKLMEKVKAEILECACIIELPELEGRKKFSDIDLFVLVQKD